MCAICEKWEAPRRWVRDPDSSAVRSERMQMTLRDTAIAVRELGCRCAWAAEAAAVPPWLSSVQLRILMGRRVEGPRRPPNAAPKAGRRNWLDGKPE